MYGWLGKRREKRSKMPPIYKVWITGAGTQKVFDTEDAALQSYHEILSMFGLICGKWQNAIRTEKYSSHKRQIVEYSRVGYNSISVVYEESEMPSNN